MVEDDEPAVVETEVYTVVQGRRHQPRTLEPRAQPPREWLMLNIRVCVWARRSILYALEYGSKENGGGLLRTIAAIARFHLVRKRAAK